MKVSLGHDSVGRSGLPGLQGLTLVLGLAVALGAALALGGWQDESPGEVGRAAASTGQAIPRAPMEPRVVVLYIVSSQEQADRVRAMEDAAEWIRLESGIRDPTHFVEIMSTGTGDAVAVADYLVQVLDPWPNLNRSVIDLRVW
jgi:hypothetical protein